MKRTLLHSIAYATICCSLFIISCSKETPEGEKNVTQTTVDQANPKNESSGIITPEDQLIAYSSKIYHQKYSQNSKYGCPAHKNFVYTCAKKLGIIDSRAIIMRDAADMPDTYQSGLDAAYNQQWSHAYIVTSLFGSMQWLWGDADDDFYDNLNGDGGELESPEGYNGMYAGYYYAIGNRDLGDWYVGYACHYITDVSFVLHTSFPGAYMALHHFDYEAWVDNNWTAGHNFSQVVNNVASSSYYTITDAKAGIRSAVRASNYTFSTNPKLAWDNYVSSGFPTGAGTGNSNCVYYTKKMIEEATKWTGGAIKYALNKYNKW